MFENHQRLMINTLLNLTKLRTALMSWRDYHLARVDYNSQLNYIMSTDTVSHDNARWNQTIIIHTGYTHNYIPLLSSPVATLDDVA